jgi:hypothetical protein
MLTFMVGLLGRGWSVILIALTPTWPTWPNIGGVMRLSDPSVAIVAVSDLERAFNFAERSAFEVDYHGQ